jgi:hypothetical protein
MKWLSLLSILQLTEKFQNNIGKFKSNYLPQIRSINLCSFSSAYSEVRKIKT